MTNVYGDLEEHRHQPRHTSTFGGFVYTVRFRTAILTKSGSNGADLESLTQSCDYV